MKRPANSPQPHVMTIASSSSEIVANHAVDSACTESISVRIERIGSCDVVVARSDFSFMGGSMGIVHGDRIVEALALARSRRLPFVAVIASGGARTQEGFDALFQMARTSEAMHAARAAGIPTLAVFTHPTAGGVHASYAAAADVIFAHVGATVGFAGPRVVEALTGHSVGDDSHTAEAYYAAGLVDMLIEPADTEQHIARWVRLVHPMRRQGLSLVNESDFDAPPTESALSLQGWDAVNHARDASRPSFAEVLADVFDEQLVLRGDRQGTDDDVVQTVIARLGTSTVMVVGLDRNAPSPTHASLLGAPSAVGFRKARRAWELASRWGIPVVTFIDTSGADATPESDNDGVASAISEAMISLLGVAAPTVSVVIGEGGSGGAMAFACTDVMVMQDDSVFEVIAPEGAAAILLRDSSRASEAADAMQLGAGELRAQGYSDFTLAGPTSVGRERAHEILKTVLVAELGRLGAQSAESRRSRRNLLYSSTRSERTTTAWATL